MILWRQIAVGNPLALIFNSHEIAMLGSMLLVVHIGERLDRPGEAGMRRHIGDALAGVPHLASVAQRLNIIRSSSNGHESQPPESMILLSKASNFIALIRHRKQPSATGS